MNIFVDPHTGNDSNLQFNDVDHPLLSFALVMQVAMPGDSVFILGGDFTDKELDINGRNAKHGTPAAPIIWRPYPGDEVWLGMIGIGCHYHMFDGINIDGKSFGSDALSIGATGDTFQNAVIRNAYYSGIACHSWGPNISTYTQLRGLKVHDCGNRSSPSAVAFHGIYFFGGDDNVIEFCEFWNMKGNDNSYGVQIFDNTSDSRPSRNNIHDCSFHDNNNGFTMAAGGSDNVVQACAAFRNKHSGFDIQSGHRNQLINCQSYGNGIGIYVTTADHALISGNESWGNSALDLFLRDTSLQCQVINNKVGSFIYNEGSGNVFSGNQEWTPPEQFSAILPASVVSESMPPPVVAPLPPPPIETVIPITTATPPQTTGAIMNDNVRTFVMYLNGTVYSIKNGVFRSFNNTAEFFQFVADNSESVQQLGDHGHNVPMQEDVDFITGFDHVLYTQGWQPAFDFMTAFEAQHYADIAVPPVVVGYEPPVQNTNNPGGPLPPVPAPVNLAGLSPLMMVGIAVGAYFMLKKGGGRSGGGGDGL